MLLRNSMLFLALLCIVSSTGLYASSNKIFPDITYLILLDAQFDPNPKPVSFTTPKGAVMSALAEEIIAKYHAQQDKTARAARDALNLLKNIEKPTQPVRSIPVVVKPQKTRALPQRKMFPCPLCGNHTYYQKAHLNHHQQGHYAHQPCIPNN